MAKYVRDISESFHANNRTKIKKAVLCTSTDYIYLTEQPDSSGKYIIKNKQVGIYLIKFDKKSYLINIKETLAGNDQLVIENKDKAYTIINGVKKFTSLYRTVFPSHYTKTPTVPFTINDNFESIGVTGKTVLANANPTPYKPTTINSMGSFTLTTSNSDNSKQNQLSINLKNNLKKLPNSTSDLFVMNSMEKEAYIIYRVGRIILTGAENWYAVEENKKYCIYNTVVPSASIGEDDRSINCNYFPTITYTNMMTDTTKTYAISNCNNKDTPGFYIRIPTDLIGGEPSIDKFKKFIRTALKTNPIIVEYQLANVEYRPVLLDEYCIAQFYPETNIKTSDGTISFCFYKALAYDDKNDINRNILQFNL